ncbi:MAG: RtcB family protein [Desulfamplus sp.]|nr:RtcB family protein [Desulfamplus sp.]
MGTIGDNLTKEKSKTAPYKIWGENLDPEALLQMEQACSLPISVRGALMPDAHKGYGLPIGGVLAVNNAVIPYAVGVDIACRVCMTVLDIPYSEFEQNRGRFKIALEKETKFGVGEEFSNPKNHKVMDQDWGFCSVVKSLKDKAWRQLGTSGSGNHFAEFGKLTLDKDEASLKLMNPYLDKDSNTDSYLKSGEYLALLTHSGSRGAGSEIADYYSKLAKKVRAELPASLKDLAWFDMDSHEGQEYWIAMELMGRYSEANHEVIHDSVVKSLGGQSILTINNHHNFAWKTSINLSQLSAANDNMGNDNTANDNNKKIYNENNKSSLIKDVIVHRKGATPAGKGVVGIIPGSMASPAFVVKGVGNPFSLESAAHGAGRRMSRNAAMKQYKWSDLDALLRQRGVSLISAGLDEVPMAYKNIEEVMSQQRDLVSIIARFDPKLVKMSPPDKKHLKKR